MSPQVKDPPDGAPGGSKAIGVGDDDGAQHNRPCPPDCATACALGPRWRRALLTDGLADPTTRTFWSLCGLWGDADLAEVTAAAADAFGPRTVADALTTASRWATIMPHEPSRLAALAAAWRREAEGVIA